ncbi:hypothetical protein DMUE_1707 [Dictyocoela muelleri]|nr:hypothetical protein DMUE_1707 [Dictyocoela muelleri]
MQNNGWFTPFSNSVWPEEDSNWNEEDWRIVGSNPYKRRSKSVVEVNLPKEVRTVSVPQIQYNNVTDLLNNIEDLLYVVEFNSGRLDIGYSGEYKVDDYVILEADRGEDCGKIIALTNKTKYKRLLNKIDKNNINKEIHPKKIYRKAAFEDLDKLAAKKNLENVALERCKEKVRIAGLDMLIVDCEYQWDMNKLIFYFFSDKKIDFRELVKDLYKDYKIRIWMCAVEKSKNCHLKKLVEN